MYFDATALHAISGHYPISQTGGARSGALEAISAPIDPDLQRLLDAWPTLPDPIKVGIIAMVRFATPNADGTS